MSYEDIPAVDVHIILGSDSDLPVVQSSGMLEIFQTLGISWELNIISAHRHPRVLGDFAEQTHAKIYLAVAGMAAALGGMVSAHCGGLIPVIAVALAPDNFLSGLDALLSTVRMPPGRPVLTAGLGVPGLRNAAIAAAQILAIPHDSELWDRLESYLKQQTPEPQVRLLRSETYVPPQKESA